MEYNSIIKEQDFSEIKILLNKARDSKLAEEEHNRMMGYAIKYPNSASISVYFLILKEKQKWQWQNINFC